MKMKQNKYDYQNDPMRAYLQLHAPLSKQEWRHQMRLEQLLDEGCKKELSDRKKQNDLLAKAGLNALREGIRADIKRRKAYIWMVMAAAKHDIDLEMFRFKMSQEKYPLLYKAAKEEPKLLRRMFEQVYECWENGCFEESLQGIEQDLLEGKRDNFRNIKMSEAYWNKLLEDEDFRLYVENEEAWKKKHANEKEKPLNSNWRYD